MIKAVGEHEGRPLLILGLSRGNIDNLEKGKPILVKAKVHDGPLEILIVYGETEEAIMLELEAGGVRMPTVSVEEDEGHKRHVHG